MISAKIMHKKRTGEKTYFSDKQKNPFFPKKKHTFIKKYREILNALSA